MIFFKTFLIFLIFCVYETNEIRHLFYTFSVRLTGIFTCKNNVKGTVVVYLSEKPHLALERNPIGMTKVRYGQPFSFTGSRRSFKMPHLFYKLVYTCSTSKASCVSILVKRIPPEFVFQNKMPTVLYKIRYSNLSDIHQPTYYICPRKKN